MLGTWSTGFSLFKEGLVMADISKCRGIDCPLRNKCYRYLAIPSRWQSYFYGEEGLSDDKTECKNLIETTIDDIF